MARGSAVRLVAWGFGSVESWEIFLWPPSSVPEDHESSGMYFKLKYLDGKATRLGALSVQKAGGPKRRPQ